MEILRHLAGTLHPNIRRQKSVEHKAELICRDARLCIKMGALAKGMHSCIRPPRSDDAALLPCGLFERGLQLRAAGLRHGARLHGLVELVAHQGLGGVDGNLIAVDQLDLGLVHVQHLLDLQVQRPVKKGQPF